MKSDAIRDLVHRLVEASYREGSFTESVAIEIERQWRLDYDKERILISSLQLARSARAENIRRSYLSNEPMDAIKKREGVSRATLYRYLKR